jgi:hypothetical protein
MMKSLLAGGCLLMAVGSANAATFDLSGFAGSGPFGTITGTDLGAMPGSTDTVQFTIDMAPNVLLDTGAHFLLTMSLDGTGRFDQSSIVLAQGSATVQAHDPAGGYSNAPFGQFTDAIAGSCGTGSSSGGCGSTFTVDVTNFQGLSAATNLFNGSSVFAAVDIFLNGCTGDACTGVVGADVNPSPTPFSATPLPGAVGLFATGLFGLMGLGVGFKDKRKQKGPVSLLGEAAA